MKALIIEDSTDIVDIVAVTLKMRWPEIELISSSLGKAGINLAQTEKPDIVLLDLGLPDTDGFQVLRAIREFSQVPIVILTVRGDETDKIRGLELGADDYIVKPFSPAELLARLRALLRRSPASSESTTPKQKEQHPGTYIRSHIRVDFASQQLSVNDRLIKLSPREYEILHLLIENEGKVVTNEELLAKVFPENKFDIRFLEVYIKKLREQIEAFPDKPEIILTAEGQGYKLVR